jgi:cell surface protein SprA
VLTGTPKPSGEPVRVEIALIEVVGNEWQEDEVTALTDIYPVGSDEGLNVTVVGTDRNPAYRPPPGVHVRRNLNSGTREREQSLVLAYTGLEPGHQMAATKILSRATSYTSYRRLSLHVHGDSTEVGYVRGDSSDLELFVRFGADSTNYYEYITRVFPGWEGGRSGWQGNEVDVDLLQMAQLKAVLQSGRLDLLEVPLAYVVLDPRGADVPAQATLSPRP